MKSIPAPLRARIATLVLSVLVLGMPAGADDRDDAGPFSSMSYRCIGPYRGGRVVAVTGVPGEPHVYYFGATGGGVWRTENAGTTWENISDGQFGTGSIGAIAVAPSDPNVIYVGTGEGPIRGVTTAHGDGLYKSTDRGKTWRRVGLENARQIPAVRVHPDDPDLVYAAAQGSPWGPGPERGVYRSVDGGITWELVLHVDGRTGACDLSLDTTNPRILYAAMWDHQRTPWQVRSGGPGSGIYKTTDGGDTWTRLTKGLPETMGKIGVAVSPADPERLWAVIEADTGGLYRSDDAGETWSLLNDHRVLRARSWYYMHVFADPADRETVYVLNAPMLKSVDGGRTFTQTQTPHGDNHALWISPENGRWMINGNDGGANVSLDGGKSWSTQQNQPTAQFYRVIADNRFPYWVYGGQQDNTTVAIASRTLTSGIGPADWHAIGGGESAHVAFDPDDPTLVYATSIVGWITEHDRTTGISRGIQAYPEFGLGTEARDVRYRFNWNAPVLVSKHDPRVIYHAANVLLRSRDRGRTWEEASPDLTRDEPEKHGPGGVPFTNEKAGAEVYNTIFYVVESPRDADELWVGSDDGLVHVTRDGGATWTDVTPTDIGEAQINAIEISPHDPGKVYLAVTRYKLDDFTPLVYRTTDGGGSWRRLARGLPEDSFVRVVREDPVREGLLFAGTETGINVSFDDGARWEPLQLNLPVVAITDLRVQRGDLVVATQGRSFWILDELGPLRQWTDAVATATVHLFDPGDALRLGRGESHLPGPGANPPDGAIIDFRLEQAPDSEQTLVRLEILTSDGRVVRTLSNRATALAECYAASREPHQEPGKPYGTLEPKDGSNRVTWDLRHENIPCVVGHVLPFGWAGPRARPGDYRARLTVGDETMTSAPFAVRPDPRSSIPAAAYAEQADFVEAVYDTIGEVHEAVERMRSVRDQVIDRTQLAEGHDAAAEIQAAGESVLASLRAWEDEVIQHRRRTQQDIINFPNRLSMQLLYLMSQADSVDPPLAPSVLERFTDLERRWARARAAMGQLLTSELARFNAALEEHGLPTVYTGTNATTRSSSGSTRWPGFRGDGTSVTSARDLPLRWSDEENVTWTVDLPGYGQSSPVVWDDRVFVTASEGPMKETLVAMCFDLDTGQVIWSQRATSTHPVESSNMVSRSAPTPAVDADRVYLFYESGDLVAVDHDGTEQWRRALTEEYGRFVGPHGVASSVALTDDAVVILIDDRGSDNYLLAIDKATGKNRWKVDRSPHSSWTTPIVSTHVGRTEIVVSSDGTVEAFDAADGARLWLVEGVEGNTVASPTAVDGTVVVGSSESRFNMAIDRDASSPETRVRWRSSARPSSFGSPLVHRGCVYIVSRAGIVTCVDLEQGDTEWDVRISGSCWASPVGAGDRVYFFGKEGVTTVLAADSSGPTTLAENTLSIDDGTVYGVAAVDGAFLVRTGTKLIRIGQP
ncbi:MAG: VPS10 domain-containing protein [Planctomycetota bacterium]